MSKPSRRLNLPPNTTQKSANAFGQRIHFGMRRPGRSPEKSQPVLAEKSNEPAPSFEDLVDDESYDAPKRSLTEILATGIQHAGGLRQLAEAELLGELCGTRGTPPTGDEVQEVTAFLDEVVARGPGMSDIERHRVVEEFRDSRPWVYRPA